MDPLNRATTVSRRPGRCIHEVPRCADAAVVWAIARALVQQQGAEAPAVAAKQARVLLDAGEIERRLTWMRVMVASQALLGREAA